MHYFQRRVRNASGEVEVEGEEEEEEEEEEVEQQRLQKHFILFYIVYF